MQEFLKKEHSNFNVELNSTNRYNNEYKVKKIFKKKKNEIWTQEEAMLFLKAARDKKLNLKYEIALQSGMRMNEILILKWEDIDFEKDTIRIRRNKRKNDNQVVKISTDIILALKKLQNSKLGKVEYINQNSEYVFSLKNGKLPHRNSWTKEFQMLIKESGVRNTTFRSLRLFYIKLQLKMHTFKPIEMHHNTIKYIDPRWLDNISSFD